MNSIVVLTTHERADWFRAALGANADYRLDCRATNPLHSFLANVKISGGDTVVVDEDHFTEAGDLLSGVERYINGVPRGGRSLRIIVVSSKRMRGDRFLSRLAGYCHIYDLLYGVDGVGIVEPLQRLLSDPNDRSDVIELLDYAYEERTVAQRSERENLARTGFIRPGQRLLLEVIVR